MTFSDISSNAYLSLSTCSFPAAAAAECAAAARAGGVAGAVAATDREADYWHMQPQPCIKFVGQ
jgi:hypothetical protein